MIVVIAPPPTLASGGTQLEEIDARILKNNLPVGGSFGSINMRGGINSIVSLHIITGWQLQQHSSKNAAEEVELVSLCCLLHSHLEVQGGILSATK